MFSLIPNVTHLRFRHITPYGKIISFAINETFEGFNSPKRLKLDKELLKNLKSLQITAEFGEIFEFFTSIMEENSLTECVIEFKPKNEPSTAIIKKIFHNFFAKQKSVKKLEIDINPNYILSGLKLLNLDELIITFKDDKTLKSTIKNQQKIKRLKINRANFGNEILKEICKLSNLEALSLSFRYDRPAIDDWEILNELKNLKELKFDEIYFGTSFFRKFRSLKMDSLETLKLDRKASKKFLKRLAENFPNLKDLEAGYWELKLNLFAKYFLNLEKLLVRSDDISHIVAINKRISHENLRELTLDSISNDTLDRVEENFLEIFRMFPNLSSFEVTHRDTKALKLRSQFFSELLKHKLKFLKISFIPIKNCHELAVDLNNLADKIERIKIKIEGRFYNVLNKNEKENLRTFKEMVENHFEVTKGYYEDYEVVKI